MKLNLSSFSVAVGLALALLNVRAQDPAGPSPPKPAPAAPTAPVDPNAAAPTPSTNPKAAVAPLAWFAGTWDISYEDAALGTVRGQAVVRTDDGTPFIKYVVTDPRDGTRHDLVPFNVKVGETEVMMELPPGGPSAANGNEGAAGTAGISTEVVPVPLGTRLRAKLGDAETSAIVTAVPSRAYTRLRLERKGTQLTGEWVTARDSYTGFQGARSGTSAVEMRSGPAELGDKKVNIMRGTERWELARMLVERVSLAGWQHDRRTATHLVAHVRIEGRNLPDGRTGKDADIRFSDPLLTALNAEIAYEGHGASLTFPVSVALRTTPGPKSFTLRNGDGTNEAPGIWSFEMSGEESRSIAGAATEGADGQFRRGLETAKEFRKWFPDVAR